ncbi:MAG: hypothetical protein HKN79_00765 [Flavobacteriales bacterium]|nr:hypothetical protein [Flavobacteriales bacterium]
MLELSKKVLDKVSFDRLLFRKELHKAIKWVTKEERLALQAWCLVTYGHMYKDVILESFNQVV